ncbi:sensor histidine kinase [Phenylobacterium sp.]|uniref:sensor histidine kinase n=1 Tax=Phenylobacterium sp. TaxID=1871053 RepID=UPI002F40C2A3
MTQVLAFEPPPVSTTIQGLLDLDQAVLDALPMGVYACDADGRIVRANRRAAELWGQSPRLNDPTQKFCGSFRVELLDGQFVPPDATPMAHAVRTGEGCRGVEAVVQNPDGRRWVASVTIEPLMDDDGVLLGAVNCFQDITREFRQRRQFAEQQRTMDLAMVAANMGAWRYTVADNICLYDEHAQRLYGLTNPRFLHDDEGVKNLIHADDLERMWAAVAKACDAAGDGRYDVEYRVKQLDGSWRWLSAWGIVEFDSDGPERKPVAISGASRDLTEIKLAEEHQKLLINELNHRVKNTLATVQSITSQTLRSASDIGAARQAIDARIGSLARAHDLLTDHNWSGARLSDVVSRALEPFGLGRFDLSGPNLHVSPRHALALSMALHELATNAVKHGALKAPEGRVAATWSEADGQFCLSWRESGGPPVTPPTRRGFGSRLLEEGLMHELGGRTRLAYHPDGVSCEVNASL